MNEPTIPASTPCPNCKGRGGWDEPEDCIVCEVCGGSGRVRNDTPTPPAPAAGLLVYRFRKWFRRWSRALIAYRKPLRFAEWVNEQRCSVTIENDPSGQWRVRIGCLTNASVGRSIGEAMSREFWAIDQDPNWTWTCDYLENIEMSGGGHV